MMRDNMADGSSLMHINFNVFKRTDAMKLMVILLRVQYFHLYTTPVRGSCITLITLLRVQCSDALYVQCVTKYINKK